MTEALDLVPKVGYVAWAVGAENFGAYHLEQLTLAYPDRPVSNYDLTWRTWCGRAVPHPPDARVTRRFATPPLNEICKTCLRAYTESDPTPQEAA
jgi:hypothetical protein